MSGHQQKQMNLVGGWRIKPKLSPEPPMDKVRDRPLGNCFGAAAGVKTNSICFLLRPGGFAILLTAKSMNSLLLCKVDSISRRLIIILFLFEIKTPSWFGRVFLKVLLGVWRLLLVLCFRTVFWKEQRLARSRCYYSFLFWALFLFKCHFHLINTG